MPAVPASAAKVLNGGNLGDDERFGELGNYLRRLDSNPLAVTPCVAFAGSLEPYVVVTLTGACDAWPQGVRVPQLNDGVSLS